MNDRYQVISFTKKYFLSACLFTHQAKTLRWISMKFGITIPEYAHSGALKTGVHLPNPGHIKPVLQLTSVDPLDHLLFPVTMPKLTAIAKQNNKKSSLTVSPKFKYFKFVISFSCSSSEHFVNFPPMS